MNDRIIIEGICQAVTEKAVLLGATDTDDENWFPLRYVRVITGHIGRGAWCELSIPSWLHEEKTGKAATRENLNQKIPAEMLKRLIVLCHPSRHSDMVETSTAAHNWLLQVKNG